MLDRNTLQETLKGLKELVLPRREVLLSIFSEVKDILAEERNVLRIEGNATTVGDLHGQYFDFLNMLEKIDRENKVVFLGDYVDRGYNSVELFTHLLIMKILQPERIFLLRGNHETQMQTRNYGFINETILKYDYYVYWKFCEVFEFLPLAAIINEKYFCVHGGIAPGVSVGWIESSDRFEDHAEISTILWSDPKANLSGFKEGERGAGSLFGRDAVSAFLEENGCSYIVRSHQLVQNGVEEMFDGKCITIWSSPNYCYKCKNAAAIMNITAQGHNYEYFEAVEQQYILGPLIEQLRF